MTEPTDLLAAVLRVHQAPAEHAAPIPLWLGRAAQAWLLDQVRRTDAALADVLHAGQSRRPYTVSGLRGSADQIDQEGRWLRITSFDATLSGLLLTQILPALPGQAITLAGARFTIEQVILAAHKHSWAAHSSYEALAQQALLGDMLGDVPRLPPLAFATPTAFHRNRLAVPLPLPALVFGSLVHAWDHFSPVPLPARVMPFVERWVGLAQHRIATRMVQFGDSERQVGFTGTVRYQVMPLGRIDLPPEAYRQQVQLLHLLTQFAFYAGVGARTAVGMGQVRPLNQANTGADPAR